MINLTVFYFHQAPNENNIIDELSSTSAAGPNGIPSLLLINCAAELAPTLKLLFTQSLMHGFIPASLKRAFNSQKFHYMSYSSSLSSNNTHTHTHIYIYICKSRSRKYSTNVLDLGIFMSRDCSFEFQIKNWCKNCTNISGWILRTFSTRDNTTTLTLYK